MRDLGVVGGRAVSKQEPVSGYLSPDDIDRLSRVTGGTVQKIVREVSASSGIPVDDLLGRSRKPHIAQARFLCWYVAREHGMSLQQIGRAFGRDHSTIVHGIQREAAARLDAQRAHDARRRA